MSKTIFAISFVWLMASGVLAFAESPDFEADIAPIFVKRCLECHNARDANGGLVLINADNAMAGGDSGAAIVPGQPESSSLWERVSSGEMPPPRRGKPQTLPESEQKLLQKWIADGAHWPAGRNLDLFEATNDVRAGRDWWSLRPIQRTELQTNSLDRFIAEKLLVEKMEPAPPAEKSALIRRVYDDLVGLPPTYEQIQEFVNDPDPQAYEKLVDRLIASPHFGERQARHWLDTVRFAESCGYERDQVKPFAWKYRDWVVQAFNEDKPYDRFVMEQLAGDELPDRSEESVIGTGFLMLGTWNDEPNDPQEYKYERLEDLVHTTSSAFLGLTVKCARCHDHKFDPIPQEDYYRMAGAFWPGAIEPRGRELIGGVTTEELGFPEVLGWTDIRRDPPPFHLLKKGEPKHPLGVVEPAHLSFVPELLHTWNVPAEDAKTSQRRLQLARWLVDPSNPLTPRVMVNRLWQHHFGLGLVRSPNDFGFNGAKPTHPELLDALAGDFVDHGWKMKRLHKLMVMSQTYRQSSIHPKQDEYQELDAGNLLWWHAERHRRDAESLRDAMLTVTGEIDLRLGGPSFKPSVSSDALEGLSMKSSSWHESPPEEQRRRSLYIFSQRNLLTPLMTTFDFPDTTLPCAQRDRTTVAPQALALMNGQFVQDRSRALAQRVAAAKSNPADQIALAWELALGRAPTESESMAATNYLSEQKAYFANWVKQLQPTVIPTELPVSESLVLHLRADRGLKLDDQNRVEAWQDHSTAMHHASQTVPEQRPLLVSNVVHGRPALRFQGQGHFLHLNGQVLKSGEATIFAVINDREPGGHREIFSNWNGAAGNSTTSIFLGLTGQSTVRLSDVFNPAGEITDPMEHFLLIGQFHQHDAAVYQNERELARHTGGLGKRNLTGEYVIGQQGNINGEYWRGDIAELIVFDRSLSDAERQQVSMYLMNRYQLAKAEAPPDPPLLAFASLCQVLLNTNEFAYVD